MQLAEQHQQQCLGITCPVDTAAGVAAQHSELSKMAVELAHSKKELQEAFSAVAELQQQTRQLKRELSR